MTKSEFYKIIEDIAEVPPGTVKGNEQLSDWDGWDSLAIVAFIAAMDKHLNFAVPPKPLVQARSVPDLVALVAEHLTD